MTTNPFLDDLIGEYVVIRYMDQSTYTVTLKSYSDDYIIVETLTGNALIFNHAITHIRKEISG